MIILQNPNFLAQLVTEGMKLAMDNYVNHLWMENMLNPLAPVVAPILYHSMQPLWNLPRHFNTLLSLNPLAQLPFFTPQEVLDGNPLFFPWVPIPLQGHATQNPSLMPMDRHQPPIWQTGNEVQEEAPKGSFSEISTLRQAALMIFQEKEDKKYVHICPISLLKCFFDLRPAVNSAIAKGGNTPAFKRNFRDLIHNHKPCMVALLETRMTSHGGLKDEFGFDDFFEVPAEGSRLNTTTEIAILETTPPGATPILQVDT
ncbi:hypothetical protein H5410_027602 [Solanum commersonii]|uniref:Uncharacterized protein n=1 Tax=Solanum commersonii TaxID=4109 RepID=A0A9J5Z4X8_SOLCO|nr:hypothetical protein H5410_027602 [Solanum commersonii]